MEFVYVVPCGGIGGVIPHNQLLGRPQLASQGATEPVIAAWYERQGPPSDVLLVGEMTTPEPGPGEVRIRVAASGINPGDVKKGQDTFGVGMPYARVIPHSDGAGVIDAASGQVPASRMGERVWCFGARSYRPFGTAAEYVVAAYATGNPTPAIPF